MAEETDSHLATSSLKAIVESGMVSLDPAFLQAKHTQIPPLFLIRFVLQILLQFCFPSLKSLQYLNVLFEGSVPELKPRFKVWCPAQWNSHYADPAGHTIADPGQDTTGFLGHLGTQWQTPHFFPFALVVKSDLKICNSRLGH